MQLLIEYKPEILKLLSFIYLPFVVFVIALGFVYVFGRMLGFLKSPNSKNSLAIFVMTGAYSFYFRFVSPVGNLVDTIWVALIYSSLSVVLYVLIGFKLFNRVDNLLDKVAPDETKRKKK